jgi:hypothetical protein
MTQECWMVADVTMAALLAGCATTETVMMQHPQTHEIAQCAEGGHMQVTNSYLVA